MLLFETLCRTILSISGKSIHAEPATGLRRDELLGLKWEDIELARGDLRVIRSLLPFLKYHAIANTGVKDGTDRPVSNSPISAVMLSMQRKVPSNRCRQVTKFFRFRIKQTNQNVWIDSYAEMCAFRYVRTLDVLVILFVFSVPHGALPKSCLNINRT